MKNFKKIISVILTLTMLLGTVSLCASAGLWKSKEISSLSFTTLSDTHYYPDSLTGNNCEAYQEYCKGSSKLYPQSEAIIRTAIETMVKRNPDLKYVLVPGDLTKDSELQGHQGLAEIFLEYEEKYGLEFIVINGNHDINTSDATTFENGKKEKARAITPDEFKEVYAELGYDLAYETYEDYYAKTYPGESTDVPNKLSYVVDLEDDYRLIVIDSCMYSFNEPLKQQTGGEISEELMKWIEGISKDAKAKDKRLMMMLHHGLAAHMETEPSITFAFPLYSYMEAAEQFAAWGIHYAFTGHLHTDDTAAVINDDGDVLYDYETASITGFPCTYREMTFTALADGKSEMKAESIAFDAECEFSYGGKTYKKGTAQAAMFDLGFGGNITEDGKADAVVFLADMACGLLEGFVNQINELGSVDAFLKSMNVDLGALIGGFLEPYIGDGIAVGGYNIFSVDNIMWFINDLLDQIYDLYIKEPQKLYDLVYSIVGKLGALEVSSYPSTAFVDSLGFGGKDTKGDFGMLILTVMAYWYSGNEDASEDKFIQEAIERFRSGELLEKLFNTLVDIILNDVLDEALLSKLEIRLGKLMNDDIIGKAMGDGVDYLINVILRGDPTYMNLVDTVFALEILPWTSIYDVLDQLLISKYLTPSQFEGTGTFVAYIINDFTCDENPTFKGDYDITYSSEKVEVPVTRANYRLPTMVSVTMGEDSKTSAYINWFSKFSVGGDIEIYKADSEPKFKGIPTENADFGIELKSELVERTFPGIDIGIIGFITYAFNMNRHTVSLTDLEPGATYYYRVGDAEKGWWSETGKITTADGSKNTTFFHITDPQSQSEAQYERAWANITETAFKLYPDADFILSTGDHVDNADNTKQWQWMFDTASTELMSTYFMPAAGNHETHGEFALYNNFALPYAPADQDFSTGTYYSYDYNNVHVAVLNTNDLDENEALTAKQLEWLTKDMEESDAQWKFVALHKAPYSQGSHYKDDDVCNIREQLQNLMPALGIDIVFQGHDHVYMRTGSLVNNANTAYDRTYLNHNGEVYRTQIKPTGTTYVISGTSGVKTYITNDNSVTDDYFPRGETMFGVDAPMFSAVEIEDGVLYFTAYTVDEKGATVADKFAIQKDTTQGDVAEGYTEPAVEEEKTNKVLDTINKIVEVLVKIVKVMLNIYKLYFMNPAK